MYPLGGRLVGDEEVLNRNHYFHNQTHAAWEYLLMLCSLIGFDIDYSIQDKGDEEWWWLEEAR